MKKKIFDSIVLGLGAMGSSSIYHLSKAGANVLGIEKFISPHKNGSTHGDSRVIREAYAEGLHYVKFVKRAYELWYELEKESNTKLFKKTGGIHVGEYKSDTFSLAKTAAEKFDLGHKIIPVNEINKNHRFFNFPEDHGLYCLYENNAGILFPEKCVSSYLNLARKNGAEIKFNTSIVKMKFDSTNKTVILIDSNKNYYETKNLVLSCGSWLNEVLGNIDVSTNQSKLMRLSIPVKIEKAFVFYFKFMYHHHMDSIYNTFPLYMYQPKGYRSNDLIYGFPDIGEGNHFKVALYHTGNYYNKYEEIDWTIQKEDMKKLINHCSSFINGFSQDNIIKIKEENCLYTVTSDCDFILDFYPENENIFICSPCSGHGFKFSSRVGEYVTNILSKKEKVMKEFSLERFRKI